jgi:hypothetical protein
MFLPYLHTSDRLQISRRYLEIYRTCLAFEIIFYKRGHIYELTYDPNDELGYLKGC